MEKSKKLAAKIAAKLKEISATGTGASFTPGSGIQTAEPFVNFATHKTHKKPYFYKLGYKLAPYQVEEANPGASLGKGPSAGKSGVKNSYCSYPIITMIYYIKFSTIHIIIN